MGLALLDIDNATLDELESEYAECEANWGKWSCECFGFYIEAIRCRIIKLKNQTPCEPS